MSEHIGEIEDKLNIETFDVQSGQDWEDVLRSVDDPNRIPVRVLGDRVLPLGGVFSDREMRVAIELGHIVQYPREPDMVNGGSMDVRIGRYFYRTDQLREDRPGLYNFHDQEDVDEYFGEPLEAQPLSEVSYLQRKFGHTALKNLDPDALVIYMKPGERILAHTHGMSGIYAPGSSSIHAKSTTGRNGFTVCKDASIGNPNYVGRWTLELENTNHEHIILPVGMPIAQNVFYATGGVAEGYQTDGSYQTAANPEQYMRDWTPEDMKPKVKPIKPIYGREEWEN